VLTLLFLRGLILKLRYELCGSRKPSDGASSIRMVPLVSGVYPLVPPSGITLTERLEEEIATGLPPDWNLLFAGTIDMIDE